MNSEEPCPFCEIVAGRLPATILREWNHGIAILPLKPVAAGHVLILPRQHVRDFREDPAVSAWTMAYAAEIAPPVSNVITSAGRDASQSVFHLHLHVVPRKAGDGLKLPWYSGKRKRSDT